ncbi:unnamed protein product [Acanthoscelides obtectus]|uniref:Uncharacterized protein n=1 Tax=Acanthoscelides obtectus TaxID=200917 RepID=A0A9P0MCI1_ACAOB|nr:unnamed protein product [Acanthoscelides obtectus]CAK1641286.1 hypothetical protein AOBTE_LOCUS12304 [Acanthoscelides obtectus]
MGTDYMLLLLDEYMLRVGFGNTESDRTRSLDVMKELPWRHLLTNHNHWIKSLLQFKFLHKLFQNVESIASYDDIHEATESGKAIKRDLYQKLALKTFLLGLKEPLGTTVRCMKPTSLSGTLQLLNMGKEKNHDIRLGAAPILIGRTRSTLKNWR